MIEQLGNLGLYYILTVNEIPIKGNVVDILNTKKRNMSLTRQGIMTVLLAVLKYLKLGMNNQTVLHINILCYLSMCEF